MKAAYNHAVHLPARREMMQAWAGHLNSLRNGAEVISLRAQAGIGGLKPATAFCHRVSSHQLPPTTQSGRTNRKIQRPEPDTQVARPIYAHSAVARVC